jgi:hypothetical protein
VLSGQLTDTIGKLWNNAEDKAFLTYNAEKIAKYITIAKNPQSTAAAKDEANFNLDMLRASIGAYAAQKAIIAGQSAQETAKQVVAFAIGVLMKYVPV